MKRIITVIVAVVIMASSATFTSCAGNGTLPSTSDELKSAITEKFSLAQQEFEKLSSQEEKDAFEKAFYDDILGLCSKVIKANPDKEVAVVALVIGEQYADASTFSKMVSKLSARNQEDPTVISLKKAHELVEATAEGKMFLDFEVNGVKFSDYIGKGKYVLVDFWASWCGPCRGEIPNIKEVYEKYAGDQFDVLSVAVWDDPVKTAAAAEEEGIVWNQIVDAQKIPTDLYGIKGIPQIMLFSPDGTILKRDLRGSDIEKAVKDALGK